MRIDSAILSNAIITASSENPIVSGSAQVDITNTTGYSTFSSSIKTYADAKVAGLVDSAPGTLDTLNELAAALGDDANLSASIATSIGNRLLTSTHNTYSASADAHLDANISSLSGSAHTRRNQQISALSASAHTRREEISASLDATIDALDTLGISTDTERGALSSSAHTQRVALNSAQTSANNTLSSSIATALRAEITSGDAAFLTSASIGATINDNAVKLSGIESGATADQSDSEIKTAYENNSDTNAFTDALLSKLNAIESGATADQSNAEIRAAVEAASDSNVFTDADHTKLNAIEASADVTDTTNVVAALTAGTNVTIGADGTISSTDTNTTYSVGDGGLTQNNFTNALKTKLDGIEASADVTDTTNVTAAGAVMDSELTNESAVKAINQGLTTTSDVTFADLLVTGDLTVQGSRTELQVTSLNVEDLNITVASGSSDSSAADGAGITIAGANESLTWDHGNSRFNFSDDLHVVGNITVSGNVDGRDVATDGTKLDGIESGATADQTDEEIQDIVGAMLTGNTESGITVTYQDGDGTIDFSVASQTDNNFTTTLKNKLDGIAAGATNVTNNNQLTNGAGYVTSNTQLSDEQVQDIVGGMVSGNSESGITVTYQDGDGTIDFSVASQTDNNFTNTLKSKLDGIASGATNVTNNNQLTNGAGYTTNTGTVTSVAINTSAGLDGGSTITTSGTVNLSLDLSELTDMTADVVGSQDELILLDNGAERRKQINEIKLSQFNNDSGFTTYTSNQTLNNNSNVHFEGLMVGQTSGATGNTIRCVGDIVAYYSDDRLKNKIGNLEDALSKVNSLNGFTYTPNEAALALGVDQDEVRVGVSAQEVQAVLPEAVKDAPVENTEGYLTVQYEKVVPLLIEAIKELSAKVEELSK